MRYHNEATLTNVFEHEIEIPPIELPAKKEAEVVGNRLVDLPFLPAGEYIVEASAEDAAVRPVISSLQFQVSAPGEVGRNYRNDTQLALQPDKTIYEPSQTANILVETPFSGTALVTVEREKVLPLVYHAIGRKRAFRSCAAAAGR